MPEYRLSAENVRFLQAKVEAGCFATVDEAVNSILAQERNWDDMVREKIAAGLADIKAGRYTDYDEESLTARFEELKSRARQASGKPG